MLAFNAGVYFTTRYLEANKVDLTQNKLTYSLANLLSN